MDSDSYAQKISCHLKRDHVKMKLHLPTINCQGTCQFSGGYLISKYETKWVLWPTCKPIHVFFSSLDFHNQVKELPAKKIGCQLFGMRLSWSGVGEMIPFLHDTFLPTTCDLLLFKHPKNVHQYNAGTYPKKTLNQHFVKGIPESFGGWKGMPGAYSMVLGFS